MNICIFAASSSKTDKIYQDAASELGRLIALDGHAVVYGGGGIGLMGDLANSAIRNGGRVTGVIPEFMHSNGWGHDGIDEVIITEDMGSRKKKIFELSDAIIALPGGIGTLEELTEAITLKQLGLYSGALVILNINGFYQPVIDFLETLIKNGFMRDLHRQIWAVADNPQKALETIYSYKNWNDDPVKIARI